MDIHTRQFDNSPQRNLRIAKLENVEKEESDSLHDDSDEENHKQKQRRYR